MEHVTSHLCMTRDLGVGGNLFGGTMMAWMDEAAGIYAHVYTSEPRMVTLKYAELLFRYPVRERDRVEIYRPLIADPKVSRRQRADNKAARKTT